MKSALLWIVLLFTLVQTWAQTMPSKSAKPDFKLFFEKVYLHTDRDVYALSDTLWFKAYLVNGQDNKLFNISKTLYVELINADSTKIIKNELIRLEDGVGNGDFELADSLPAGKYRLRAHTNWMHNFGDNFIYEKEITLLNTTAVPQSSRPVVKISAANKKSNVKTNIKPVVLTPSPNIRFYPEGGSLVQSLGSLVAVKAEDGTGKGISAYGFVLSAPGDTVARFTCDSLGMGLFALLPVKGLVYHAVVRFEKGPASARFDLPRALNEGLTMQVRHADSILRVLLSTSADPAALATKPIYTLTVKHSGIPIVSQTLQLTAQQISVSIPTLNLPEGISAITVYDDQNKPNCERLIYVHHPGSNPIIITTDKKNYLPREQVNMQINTAPNTSMSMAVVDAGLTPMQADDIIAYLMLKSEIKGNVEHASRYFDTTNINRAKQLDLLLMTQGWRDFVWRKLADTAINIAYAAESGIGVSGTVSDELNKKPAPNLSITLFANAAKGDKIYNAGTNSTGRFNIDNLVFYGRQPIKLTATNTKGQKWGSFDLDTTAMIPIKPAMKWAVPLNNYNAVTDKINKQIQDLKKLNLYKVTALKEVTIKSKATNTWLATHDKHGVLLNDDNGLLYPSWGPLQTYNITSKDYWTKTLSWYLIQTIDGASPAGTSPSIRIGRDRVRLIVNGVSRYISEELYYSMPIEKFKTIEVQRTVMAFNPKILIYFIFLTTKANPLEDNPGYLDATAEGYYQARTFYQPPAGAPPSLADYRTTIHWEPFIKTDATGKATVSFYNGSGASNARIIVQGITDKGPPVSATASYAIK